MKEIQVALKDLGIPVYAQIFSPTGDTPIAAAQYVTYTVMSKEENYFDDAPHLYRRYVYLYLWSDVDPTPMAKKIRRAMRSAGFDMVEETDQGYNRSRYDYNTSKYAILWTWTLRVAVDDWPE